jgi:protein-tyrosine phosphatase
MLGEPPVENMIGVHCHILPLVDDRAASWVVVARMCQMALDDGVTHLAATPNANSEFSYHRNICAGLVTELQKRPKSNLRFSLGCDFIYFFDNMEMLFASP